MHTDTSSIFASIIIPIYNAEKWLEECIHSVLAQSDPDFELLLIDDGSKDCSSSICEKYQKKDTRIKRTMNSIPIAIFGIIRNLNRNCYWLNLLMLHAPSARQTIC